MFTVGVCHEDPALPPGVHEIQEGSRDLWGAEEPRVVQETDGCEPIGGGEDAVRIIRGTREELVGMSDSIDPYTTTRPSRLAAATTSGWAWAKATETATVRTNNAPHTARTRNFFILILPPPLTIRSFLGSAPNHRTGTTP